MTQLSCKTLHLISLAVRILLVYIRLRCKKGRLACTQRVCDRCIASATPFLHSISSKAPTLIAKLKQNLRILSKLQCIYWLTLTHRSRILDFRIYKRPIALWLQLFVCKIAKSAHNKKHILLKRDDLMQFAIRNLLDTYLQNVNIHYRLCLCPTSTYSGHSRTRTICDFAHV